MTAIARGHLPRPGTSLFYEVTGTGPAIVFAHGLGGNHMSWWQQVAAFRDRFTCVSIAHRGFAPSAPVEGGPRPEDFAGDAAALLDHLGLETAVFVGQSMGGWTGVELALAAPARLRGLVLSATSGTIDPRSAAGADLAGLDAWEQESRAVVQRCQAAGIHVACGERMAREQPALHCLYQQVDGLSLGLDKEQIRTRLWAARRRPATDLAGIACPVLWITGDEDVVFPSLAAPALAHHCHRAEHVELRQTGHSGYFERAAHFNAALDGFLARH